MHLETGGKLETSPRLAKLLVPVYGVTDELRVVFRERDAIWGGLCPSVPLMRRRSTPATWHPPHRCQA